MASSSSQPKTELQDCPNFRYSYDGSSCWQCPGTASVEAGVCPECMSLMTQQHQSRVCQVMIWSRNNPSDDTKCEYISPNRAAQQPFCDTHMEAKRSTLGNTYYWECSQPLENGERCTIEDGVMYHALRSLQCWVIVDDMLVLDSDYC